MAIRRFSTVNFFQRWFAALVLVLATFNPTGYSYLHWVSGPAEEALPFKVVLGIVLAISYIVFLQATWRSIGPIGVGLVLAFFGAVLWMLFYYEILAFEQTTVLTYIGLVVLASILALGMSWSHIHRRMSGQVDMDDVED